MECWNGRAAPWERVDPRLLEKSGAPRARISPGPRGLVGVSGGGIHRVVFMLMLVRPEAIAQAQAICCALLVFGSRLCWLAISWYRGRVLVLVERARKEGELGEWIAAFFIVTYPRSHTRYPLFEARKPTKPKRGRARASQRVDQDQEAPKASPTASIRP